MWKDMVMEEILGLCDEALQMQLVVLRTRVESSCEFGTEPSGSMKCW
jgi:hypothetical protein